MITTLELSHSLPNSAVAKTTVELHRELEYAEVHHKFTGDITASCIRDILLDLDELIQYLKTQGIKRLYTGAENADAKMIRYWRLLGFKQLKEQLAPIAVLEV